MESEYSASGVKHLLWFVETRETARLLKEKTPEEVRRIVLEQNIYQQKDHSRIVNEYSCILKRIQALPLPLTDLLLCADVTTAKLIVLISAMATDRLLFELIYEVYRTKIRLGEDELKDSDLNMFFSTKASQSDLIAGWTEATITKLKRTYARFLIEAGLLRLEGKKTRKINRPFMDPDLRQILLKESMSVYYYALTGEQ